ncbi:FliA/WhiG family RNA polymerase sigma factor [Paenalkalicoccus suaedae]|uniref:FliA/WhiG family RNA polymerase sigma factor n=1 Tax=Paenalkalicoccus suaedae TaxID=2592382 RepID=A0A859FFE7_9BACI|nr:FliA/WhiG family RNA polymerase sigma factor [Paenalkalicoccus suaedae]QKS71412.1 FliA/WhiG family RNA polymerase sigma factor [Paenalkalicoccus suaedae]
MEVAIKDEAALKRHWELWTTDRDNDAGDALITSYMPLVDFHVQRIKTHLPKNVQVDDLRSHGLLGLYDAIEKFDHDRELKFDTYASFRIRGAIIDGLRQEDWLPRSVRDRSKKIEQSIERLEQQHGRIISPEEVAMDLELSVVDVMQTMNDSFFSHLLSIDEPSDFDKDETYAATIVDHDGQTPEKYLDKKLQLDEVKETIKKLNENEQLVISLFYVDEMTLTEIGEIMGLSTSRISQIHSKCMFKLQQLLKKQQRSS